MKETLDRAHLDRATFGDDALRNEVLALFRAQLDEIAVTFAPDLDDDVWGELAHKLKGAARGIGAMRIGALCADAETMYGGGAETLARRERFLADLGRERVAVLAAMADVSGSHGVRR